MKHERRWLLGCLGVLLAGVYPSPGNAQGVRGEVRVVGRYIQYRTVVRDSLPEDQVPGDGTTRSLPDGTIVTCSGGYCYWYRAGSEESTTPVAQDLRFTAWAGPPGLSARVNLRTRFGSDSFWPRSSQDFDALNAYLDYARSTWRVRAGRLDHRSGLGTYYFDGGALLWKGLPWLRVEGYVGRSLARVIRQPRTGSLLAETDNLPPDDGSTIWGLEAKARAGRVFSGSVFYQREVRQDRGGLYSERVGVDARFDARTTVFEGTAHLDWAALVLNEARLRVRQNVSTNWLLQGEVRHYQPFLELWTIWGAFSPVGFTEVGADAYWTVRPGLVLDAGMAYRNYRDTSYGADNLPVEGDGWRADVGGTWTRAAWTANGVLGVHSGFAAYRSRLDLSVGRDLGRNAYLALFGSGTQQFLEFRFGDGRSYGLGLDGWVGLGSVRLDGMISLYQHTFENRPGFDDYTQWRGRLGLSWFFGSEPRARTIPYRREGVS